jgi:hypothetical protein
MVRELEGRDEAVLAYPFTRRIGPDGKLLPKPARAFQTAGMVDLDERWAFVCRELVASGDMVYGLARVEAVRAAGIFRDVICPDRLLMAELALQGQFRQVPEELWFRRDFGGASVVRQRTSLFAGPQPAGGWLPPWIQHGRSLWRTYVREAPADSHRRAGRRVIRYCAAYALKHHQKSTTHKYFSAVLRGIVWSYKRSKHLVLLALFYALVYTRRAYHRSVYEVAVFTRRMGLR